jgi:hypothetical protein
VATILDAERIDSFVVVFGAVGIFAVVGHASDVEDLDAHPSQVLDFGLHVLPRPMPVV